MKMILFPLPAKRGEGQGEGLELILKIIIIAA
jgi:hypothetical protein